MNYQTTMIKICSESEKSKVECYSVQINNHKNDFDALFTKGVKRFCRIEYILNYILAIILFFIRA